MDEQEIRKIATQVYQEQQTQGQFSPMKLPVHTHNGIDNARVNIDDVDLGTNISIGLAFSANSPARPDIVTLPYASPSGITVYGIITNGAGKKASFNGSATLGDCLSSSSIDLSQGTQVIACQATNYTYIDTTDLTKCSVGAKADKFIWISDLFADLATAEVVSWDNTGITISVLVASGWTLSAFFLLY